LLLGNNMKKGERLMIESDDPRDFIETSNIEDWLISVKLHDGAWITRDIYYIESIDSPGCLFQSGYFAINVANTPLEDNFEFFEADIMHFKEFRLYRKGLNKAYNLICEIVKE